MQPLSWDQALELAANELIRSAIAELRSGHERFLAQSNRLKTYSLEDLGAIATHQNPIAAIVGCSDSRVTPEVVFDQPMGQIFASRVPGNVASDSAKWMLEIAVVELKVPLVIVMGHTRCLAVGQLIEGRISSAGGSLRLDVQKAVHRARQQNASDVYRQAVIENVGLTMENLRRDSFAVQRAIESRQLGLLGAVYDMDTGEVQLLT